MVCGNFLSIPDFLHLHVACIMSVFLYAKMYIFVKKNVLKCNSFHFRNFRDHPVIRQIDLWVVKYFVMAFTLWMSKCCVVVNILQERVLPNEFVLKYSSFTLYVALLIAIPHSFAFYCTSFQRSCVLLASKIDANANLIFSGISHS